jgi:hypothetical protein
VRYTYLLAQGEPDAVKVRALVEKVTGDDKF